MTSPMMKPLNWIAARAVTLFKVIYAPEPAFKRSFDGPSYLLPLCILGCLFALVLLLQAPMSIEWAQHQMQAAGNPQDQVAASMDLMWRTHRWAIALMPLLLLLKWLFFAAVLWLTSQIFLAKVRFADVLSVVAYSYVPVLLREAAVVFILCMRGREALSRPEAMNVTLGLNLLWPRLPLPWWTLVGNVNVFELWYVGLLTIGLSHVAAIHWRRALAMTLPSWLFAVLIQFGFVSLSVALRSSLDQ